MSQYIERDKRERKYRF